MKRCGSSEFGIGGAAKRRRVAFEEPREFEFESSSSDDETDANEEQKKQIVRPAVVKEDPPQNPMFPIYVEIDAEELRAVAEKSMEEREEFLQTKEDTPDEYYVWECLIYGEEFQCNNSAGLRSGLHTASPKKNASVLEKFRRSTIDETKIRVKISSAFAHESDGRERTNMLQIEMQERIYSIFAKVPLRGGRATKRVQCGKRYSFVRNGTACVGVVLWWGQRKKKEFVEAAIYLEQPRGQGNAHYFPLRGKAAPEDVLIVHLGDILFVEIPDEPRA